MGHCFCMKSAGTQVELDHAEGLGQDRSKTLEAERL